MFPLLLAATLAAPPEPVVVTQFGHAHKPSHVALSADGAHLLTGDFELYLWDARTGRKLADLTGEGARVTGWALADGGGHAVVARMGFGLPGQERRGEVAVVELRTAKERALPADIWMRPVADITPDGGTVAVFVRGGVLLWEPGPNRTRTIPLPAGAEGVTAVSLSADGKQVLAVLAPTDRSLTTGRVVVWDAATGDVVRSATVQGVAYYARLLPDGKRAFLGGVNRSAALVDLDGGKVVAEIPVKKGDILSKFGSTRDGARVLAGTYQSARVYDVGPDGFKEAGVFPLTDHATIDLAPDGRSVVVVGEDGRATRIDVATGKPVGDPIRVTDAEVTALCRLGRDRLAVTHQDGSTAVFDLAAGKLAGVLPARAGERFVRLSAASADGKRLAVGGVQVVTVWDTGSGKPLAEFPGTANVLAFTPDGKRLLAAEHDRVRVWDVDTKDPRDLGRDAHRGGVRSMAVSPDGRSAVTGGSDNDRTAVVWDLATGQQRFRTAARDGGVEFAGFTPDGRSVLTVSTPRTRAGVDSPTLRVWSAETGDESKAIPFDGPFARRVHVRPDGRAVALGYLGLDEIDLTTGKATRHATGDRLVSRTAEFGADGSRVYLARGRTVGVWDVAGKKWVAEFAAVGSAGDWVAWNPAGQVDGTPEGRKAVALRSPDGLKLAELPHRAGVLAGGVPAAAVAAVRFSPAEGTGAERTVEVEGPAGAAIAVTQNDRPVTPVGPPKADGAKQRLTFRVTLAPGQNVLKARAGADGEPAELSLRYDAPGAKGRVYVLAVGVSKYADKRVPPLNFAHKDAEAMADVFRKRARDRVYSEAVVEVLTDERATAENIRAKLKEFARAATPADTLLVHISGHGVTQGQRYYFLPHDFSIPAGKDTAAAVRAGGFPAEELTALVLGVKASNRVLVLDTCEGGGIAPPKNGDLKKEREAVFSKLDPSGGLFVITAAAAGEQAQEPKELGHGVLTYALLAGLHAVDHGPLVVGDRVPPRPKPNRDGAVNVFAWLGYASSQFPGLMFRYYGKEQQAGQISNGKDFLILTVGR